MDNDTIAAEVKMNPPAYLNHVYQVFKSESPNSRSSTTKE